MTHHAPVRFCVIPRLLLHSLLSPEQSTVWRLALGFDRETCLAGIVVEGYDGLAVLIQQHIGVPVERAADLVSLGYTGRTRPPAPKPMPGSWSCRERNRKHRALISEDLGSYFGRPRLLFRKSKALIPDTACSYLGSPRRFLSSPLGEVGRGAVFSSSSV